MSLREFNRKVAAQAATMDKQDKDRAPYAPAPVKEALVAFGIPFRIKEINEVLSNFSDPYTGKPQNELQYNIFLDTEHEMFKVAQKRADLVINYTLTLPATKERVSQWHEQLNDGSEYIRGGKLVVLTKEGKKYILDDYDEVPF